MKEMKTVTTFSGNTAVRANCRKIKDVFYEVNKDCFFVDGKWHRINNGLIVKNHTNNTYVKKSEAIDSLAFGVVGKTEKNSTMFGYFTPTDTVPTLYFRKGSSPEGTPTIHDIEGEIIVEDASKLPTYNTVNLAHSKVAVLPSISEKLAKDLGYEYAFGEDLMYPRISKFARKFTKTLGNGYGSLNYGSDNAIPNASRIYQKTSNEIIPTKEHYRLSKMFGDFSFGLEFETRNGYVATPVLNKLGLIPVKDGSLRLDNGKIPYEFVTVPLEGRKGFATLDKICKVLTERTSMDDRCSMHLHLGKVPTDELFIISFYKLIAMVQMEMLKMFPRYKTSPPGKNYARLLPPQFVPKTIPNFSKLNAKEMQEYISASFNPIYYFVSEGRTPDPDYNRKILQHPQSGGKWNISSRYHLVNFVPLMFKSFRTMEFRLHTPTTNRNKVFNWMLICAALVKYATNFQKEVITSDSLTLKKVLQDVYGTNSNDLIRYIEDRKLQFANSKDSDGSKERDSDAAFNFNTF